MSTNSSLGRGITRFVLSIILLGLIIICVVAAITLFNRTPLEVVSASFTCFSESTNQTFTITAKVNLVDGIDEKEAIILSSEVFNEAVGASYVVNETILNVNQTVETWSISMQRTYTSSSNILGSQHGYAPILQQISRTLQVTIDPASQTIQYTLTE